MTEIDRILDQLERAHNGEAWHGQSLRELLDGVTAEQAAARPLPTAHTIWELVMHIIAWEGAVTRRLGGERITGLRPEEDFPPMPEVSEDAWRRTRDELDRSRERLRQAMALVDPSRFDEIVLAKKYSVYVLLHGVIQHDLYHAGQIGMLKKAVQ